MTRAGEQHGFTLVEVLVSMLLAGIIFGATLSSLDFFQSNNRIDVLRNEAQDNARNTMDRLARELRNVAAPKAEPELPGALERAEPYSIVFQTIDPTGASKNPTGAMRVRYCLDDSVDSNEVMRREVQRWSTSTAPAIPSTANCLGKPEGWDSTSVVVKYMTNLNGGHTHKLFEYGPTGWSETAQIVTVEPTIFLDVNPTQPRPGETQLTSSVSLRNSNRQPIASFTATEVNGHVLLNASASTDPDGLALSYTWSEGATEGATPLPSTAQQYETPLLEKGSKHTFWLKVADPGGLNASTKQEIKLK
jgi:prepilin-type N-terminal cleavage/methylation domain-containing protein